MVFDTEWFNNNQKFLLKFANTWIGRKLLGITSKNSKVGGKKFIGIFPNCLKYNGTGNEIVVEFRVNNYYAIRIRKMLYPFWMLLHVLDTMSRALRIKLDFGFSTLQVSPDAWPGVNTCDGSAWRIGDTTWSPYFTSGSGTNAEDDQASTGITIRASVTTNQFTRLVRGFFFFDTSSLGNVGINWGKLSLYASADPQDNLGANISVNVYGSNSSSTTTLVTGDYESCLSTPFTTTKVYTEFLGSFDYVNFMLNDAGIGYIKKDGITRFSIREPVYDVGAITPPWDVGKQSYISFSTSDAFNAPILTISYSNIINTKTFQTGEFVKQKKVFAKFFDSLGRYRGVSDKVSFDQITYTINGGNGEATLKLAIPIDELDQSGLLDFMNEVQIWVSDKESGDIGKKIYSGFIDEIETVSQGGSEFSTVRTLGYITRLADVMFKSGTAMSIAKNSTDPSQMIRDIIDSHRTEDIFKKINYNAGSVQNTGTSASYTFVMKNGLESIEIARSLSPAFWYYYLDPENILWYQPRAVSAIHRFTFQKEVSKISVTKSIRDVVNRVVIWNNKEATDSTYLCRSYKDQSSVNTYGLRMENKSDGRITDSSSMDNLGNKLISERKDPNVRVTIDVIDSNMNEFGYDIESIKPGDTCKVLNLPSSAIIDDNMAITRIIYHLGYATLELEELYQTVAQKFGKSIRDTNNQFYYDGPASYTDV